MTEDQRSVGDPDGSTQLPPSPSSASPAVTGTSTQPETSQPQTTQPQTTQPQTTKPRRSTSRDLAQIAIFAALIAALGLPGTINVGSTGVPITLQTLGVMLAGGILGARKGFLSVLVFLVLTTAGLPLLAGYRGGLGIWAAPSAGYLLGFLAGVVVIGLLTARILPRYPLWQGIAVNLIGGVLVIYLFGVTWLAIRIGLGPALSSAVLYLPGDVLKAIVAALVIKQVHRSYPGLITGETSAAPPTPPVEKVSS